MYPFYLLEKLSVFENGIRCSFNFVSWKYSFRMWYLEKCAIFQESVNPAGLAELADGSWVGSS
jgi:hypothetical protein